MTPIALTPREYARLSAPDAEDAPIHPRRLRQRPIERETCARCDGTIGDKESSYHREIYGVWEYYHFACFFGRKVDHG